MNKDKKIDYSLTGIIAMVSVQAAIRFIGVDNLSSQLIVAFFTILSILFIALQYKNRTKGFGVKYNMTLAILMVLTSFFVGLMLVLLKGYPDLTDKYGGIILLLSILSFFGLALYVAIYRIIYETKRK